MTPTRYPLVVSSATATTCETGVSGQVRVNGVQAEFPCTPRPHWPHSVAFGPNAGQGERNCKFRDWWPDSTRHMPRIAITVPSGTGSMLSHCT